ncbi:hypothetical protein M501DRAFT_849737 [Patellaria atrata CBS 101060]|uniref:Uncharacterized protein n=1 Tax=Patellaria atrata CBS 101060 TaxID=1346257 RepID=A0A9P4S8I5_9PEZI|nr:hypothetical protein M501DRAFT_849737 [Patellaria atrata CBS 101060]
MSFMRLRILVISELDRIGASTSARVRIPESRKSEILLLWPYYFLTLCSAVQYSIRFYDLGYNRLIVNPHGPAVLIIIGYNSSDKVRYRTLLEVV